MKKDFVILLFFLFVSCMVFSQDYSVQGIISDKFGNKLEFVNISLEGKPLGTSSNRKGLFNLKLYKIEKSIIVFSYIGYKTQKYVINKNDWEGKYVFNINVTLEKSSQQLNEVKIFDTEHRKTNLVRIDPRLVNVIPDVSGSIEALIKTMPGVSSNNELSSQYKVRGGNFDENLVYVNDIEVYRPILIRSGQQEGLSFINPDMVSSVLFSAGGFEAKYGDKMSSVLDIKYKKPIENEVSASISLLGATMHFEGSSKSHRFTYISGVRYKTSQYVLNSLETEGEYDPKFWDFQTYLTYDLSDVWELSFLGNISQNEYMFVPIDRETSFGTVHEALQLKIYFDGQEKDRFLTYTGATAATYKPNENLQLKFIASAFRTLEEETFDIQSQYLLNELDRNLGSETFGDSTANIGIGTFLNHARNYLDVSVASLTQKGNYNIGNNRVVWGVKYQHEIVDNDLNEWELIDSAGYSMPYTDTIVSIFDYIIGNNFIASNRYSGYIQNTYLLDETGNEFSITGGIRFNYWDYNNEFIISPRLSASYKPVWEKDFLFRIATGFYYQPPFYKELRDLHGNLNSNIKSQKSYHFVLGTDYQFTAWNRPFKFVGEMYYKYLTDLIPYDVDNVRIRYHGNNNATGYAAGIDLKVNGEFVKGVDSWASLSVMQTEEDLKNDFYVYLDSLGNEITVYPGNIPRPSDQRVNVSVFFQDYFPGNPTYKMHLNVLFGTGLPFGPPKSERYKAINRMPSYRRVDIGFSKVIVSEDSEKLDIPVLKYLKSIWITAEVFNLLGVNNTISYIWVSDIENRQYAVPNSLTSRRINLKVQVKF